MKITVVIAAYNEAENIGPLTQRLIQTLDSLEGSSWKLIYVIEGTDGTVDIARQFAATRPEIEIQYGEKARGLGNAFRRGFDAIPSDTDFVVTMDADLNHQPEEIPRLLAVATDTGVDIVVGSRRVRESEVEGMPLWKSSISGLVNHFMRIMLGVRVNDLTSGFRVYCATALREIRFDNVGFAFLPEILINAATQRYKIVEEPIRFVFREAGESKMRIPATGLSYIKLFARHSLASIFSAKRHAGSSELAVVSEKQPPTVSSKNCWVRYWRALAVALLLTFASHVFVIAFGKIERWEHGLPSPRVFEYCRWDGWWYSQIMDHGYDAYPHLAAVGDEASWPFFPLFPLIASPLVHVFKMSPALAAVIASKSFLFAAILGFLFLIGVEQANLSDMVLGGTLVAFNPYVIYAHSGYAEPLYFALAAAGFTLLRRRRWIGAGTAGGLLSACRLVGVVFGVSYAIACLRYCGLGSILRERRLELMIGALLCPVGLSLWMLYIYHLTGDAFAFVHIQVAWGAVMGNPVSIVLEGLKLGHWQRVWAWTAIAGLAMSVWLTKEQEYEQAIFLGLCILVPASAELLAMPRHVWWQPPMLYGIYALLRRYRTLQLVYAIFSGGMAAIVTFLWIFASVYMV